ncbi:MAG: hypothetical protein J2P57_11280 [Acidimicrobiaceae bacterium]|nr:hypothetical protein [Acidimicrobiaceae bacterium]
MATGRRGGTNGYIAEFNGTTWSQVAHLTIFRSVPGPYVSCASSTFCVEADQSRVRTFNGSTWLKPVHLGMSVRTISCPTTKFCAVVGGSFQDQVATFNGSTWSTTTVKGPNNFSRFLIWVSCPSATFCLAIDSSGKFTTYNGSSWAPLAPVNVNEAEFLPLSCASSTFCALADNKGGVATFDGTSWSAPIKVDRAPTRFVEPSLSCVSRSFCALVDNTGKAMW